MSDTAPLTREEISAAIVEKAWKDEAFHKEVLANPNKAYEQYLGQPVPDGITIKVVEDTATTVHFVIPAKPASVGELSDAELEGVAGGNVHMAALTMSVQTIFRNVKQRAGW